MPEAVERNGANPMTEPTMIRCEGSGQEAEVPDEPTGTFQCRKCGNSALQMKTTVVDGKTRYFVPEHKRRTNPYRRRGVKTAPSTRRMSRRDSGRRR
jgi:hypothetical protein